MSCSRWIALFALPLAALSANADDPKAPASRPAGPPATGPVSAEQARIDRVLADQETAGKKLKTLSAELEYQKEDALGDVVKRVGRFLFLKPNKFRIEFDFRFLGRRKLADGMQFIFDGRRLYLLDTRRKRLTIYTLPPPKEGEPPANPLQLGRGPFPMPFGQKAADIRRLFNVKLIPATPEEAKADVTHLRLVPRPRTPMARKYKQLDLWFDGKLKLPVKLRILDKAEDVMTAKFRLKPNDPKVKPESFAEPKVDPRKWEIIREPL
jgi:outer membrane lipoprotein-sorting protein